jgi:hypothetical protein
MDAGTKPHVCFCAPTARLNGSVAVKNLRQLASRTATVTIVPPAQCWNGKRAHLCRSFQNEEEREYMSGAGHSPQRRSVFRSLTANDTKQTNSDCGPGAKIQEDCEEPAMKLYRKSGILVSGVLAWCLPQDLSAGPGDASHCLAPYFTPATSSPKLPNSDGFFQRWILLDPAKEQFFATPFLPTAVTVVKSI